MSAIEEMKSEIASKLAARKMLDDEIAALEKAVAIMSRDAGSSRRRNLEAAIEHVRTTLKAQHPRKGKLQPFSIPDLVHKFLKEAGKPLHADQLVALLAQKGRNVSKATMLSPLYRLSKDKVVFCQTSPGTFGLLEWNAKSQLEEMFED